MYCLSAGQAHFVLLFLELEFFFAESINLRQLSNSRILNSIKVYDVLLTMLYKMKRCSLKNTFAS